MTGRSHRAFHATRNSMPAVPVALAALALLAAACVNPYIPQDSSAAYAFGWGDGCDSGYSEAFRDGYTLAYRKDQARYESDAEYRGGWEDGYAVCYEDEWRMPYVMPDGGPIS